ncbi:hypothetical protein [Rhizobium sp. Leaf383]|uniref:hypothetical protein n=1 Tax=Rhizobium sp. Leaf383 TaxID=1736357 RepID=UPI000715A069|nr:hypothetical protein [Rhizobium sp. Leaf383]KQS86938.1 hypothetical protein ASG58_01435 [Rhizobium sp. Leaf383]
MRKSFLILVCLIAVGGCSADTPASLGSKAASAEIAYFVFGKNRDAHAGTFMKAWVDSCSLALKGEPAIVRQQFLDSYVQALQKEPGAAAKKPLQGYVRQSFWKSGNGCETIKTETPEWALK